ncbi:MAG TPA: type II toxin-antitoxin system HicB family antitoxin [Candidatus Binataceae bacterium]|nr:type II toxin-antitoxin system HicB family antitoxin [Candidatus Binataceae bacterium]
MKSEEIRLEIEIDRETDGRWIADIRALPGVMAYGATRKAAIANVKALALRVIADEIEHGERPRDPQSVLFDLAA